jgi:coenzyme F420-reducing hydrogenase alpha subunit
MANATVETVEIHVPHIPRVEGHGNLVVVVRNGILEQADLEITEAPRYIEALLRGQPYTQAHILASRICGICAVSHATTSLCAIEKALGIIVSEQTERLRRLNYYGEVMDSHILHIFMLVAPDLLDMGSAFPLADRNPDLLAMVLRMKKVAGDICAAICGRHTHPIAMTAGGFTHFPAFDVLVDLAERLQSMRQDLNETIDLFKSLKLPDFERTTEYLALRKDGEYTFIGGEITSSDGETWPVEKYDQVTNEYLVSHSTAKHARCNRESYMVGALARFKLNYQSLNPNAQVVARELGLQSNCINPYWNTIAQLVELVHCCEESLALIQSFLETGVAPEQPVKPKRYSGEGVGACEAPRGTLYHHYVIRNGYISEANCVIPTAQNLANIEADMRALVPGLLAKSDQEIRQYLEMLVRAYDPCISCSAH